MVGTRWAEGLQVDGATVLASYDHPHFGRWPAITTHQVDAGRVTYVGTVPNHALGRSLFRMAVRKPIAGWTGLPSSVTVATARCRDGRRLHVVHNWSWDPVEVEMPGAYDDLAAATRTAAGRSLGLGPWDVRVLVEPASG